MQFELNKQSFKAIAKNQLNNLKMRGVAAKLSDIQESLAVGYGYENLATLYAKFSSEDFAKAAPVAHYKAQPENLFVITWMMADEDHSMEEVMGIYPPGTTIDDIATRDYEKAELLDALRKEIPEGFVFSKETVALSNYAIVPRIDRHGLSDSQHYSTVAGWVKEYLGFRVPASSIHVDVHETGDDSSGRDNFLIWLNDADAKRVREMFAAP